MACGCSCHTAPAAGRFVRRFYSRTERLEWLREYLEALQAEAQAVEERIARMQTDQDEPEKETETDA